MIFNPTWAVNGQTRPPTAGELDQGFPCGDLDRELFNWLIQQFMSGLNRVGNADIPVTGFQSAPPGSPAVGDIYIVGTAPTGVWAGHASEIAIYLAGAWTFTPAVPGLQVQYFSGRHVVLRFDGTTWAEDAGVRLRNVIYQTVAGTYTYTKPAWLRKVEIELVGGGAGGGGATSNPGNASFPGGGGAGAWLRKTILASALSATTSYTVGAGGAGASYTGSGGYTGGTGGTTSFGALAACTGGQGGQDQPVGTAAFTTGGSSGGIPTGGDFQTRGGQGDAGYRYSPTFGKSGNGGASMYGASMLGVNLSQAGGSGVNPGQGGAGAASSDNAGAFNGGNGSAGLVIIREYE